MAPSAVPTNGHQGEQDVNLTASAIEHEVATTHANGNPEPAVRELDASKLTYTYTTTPKEVPPVGVSDINHETVTTDHMITVSWDMETGWDTPELKPYGPLSLMPTASCLHYATECFDGLKAYRGYDGKLRLFRPECNTERLLTSATRISLPTFDPAELEKLIVALVSVDGAKWLPQDRPGTFLYIRPTMIGTQAALGVHRPRTALMYVMLTFMRVMDTPPGGMKLHTSPNDMVRAWVGGFGYAKVGANYGPSLLATAEANSRGYQQVLWLYGEEGLCTEAGASNFFVVIQPKEAGAKPQLITAPLDDRLILDGVTRRSILQFVKEQLADEVEVVEKKYSITEVLEAANEGRLIESFAAGTAYFICPVSQIHHRGQDIKIAAGKEQQGAYFTYKVKEWLRDIVYGRADHPWGLVVEEMKQ